MDFELYGQSYRGSGVVMPSFAKAAPSFGKNASRFFASFRFLCGTTDGYAELRKGFFFKRTKFSLLNNVFIPLFLRGVPQGGVFLLS